MGQLNRTLKNPVQELRFQAGLNLYIISCFSQNTIQNMKNIQLFLDVFVLVLLVLIHWSRRERPLLAGEARICDVMMSHTWIYSWCEIQNNVFFNFFIYFCSFRSFRLFRSFRWFRRGRFGRFARFGGFVAAVSFRCFGFQYMPS